MLNNKGFSIIELTSVIIIISIIVLLAVPGYSFLEDYIYNSNIKQEIKKYEDDLKLELLSYPNNNWEVVKNNTQEEVLTSEGKIKVNLNGFYEVPLNKLNLNKYNKNGRFYTKEGKLFYSHSKLLTEIKEKEIIEKNNVTDKKALLDTINYALTLEKPDYQVDWETFINMLDRAKKVYYEENVSQEKIDRVCEKLIEIMDSIQ